MKRYVLTHLSDAVLLHDLSALAARDRETTAELLAHIAEVDERKLFLPAAYPSMFAYCVGELRLSEDAAAKRIQAARIARRFPAVYDALAEGHLNLTALGVLAPYLTEETAEELFAAAADKSKAEILRLLAERFPRTEVLNWVATSPAGPPGDSDSEHAPAHVHKSHEEIAEPAGSNTIAASAARVTALSSHSSELLMTIGRSTHEKLCRAQALLGHQVSSGDLAQVLDKILDLAIAQLEKQKFAATNRPRGGHRRTAPGSRHIPDAVRREVWERDGGQCTFVSEAGRRCEARERLEFDHVEAFARGGAATVEGIRLLCRAHNQHQAERTFGAEFMHHKRIAAAELRASVRARAEEKAHARAAAKARQEEPAHVQEVIPCMRALGYRPGEARDAARLCNDMPDASLEQRVRVALSHFRVRGTTVNPVAVAPGTQHPTAIAGAKPIGSEESDGISRERPSFARETEADGPTSARTAAAP